MRILVNFEAQQSFPYSAINSYQISSLIWNILRDTEYSDMHNTGGFKFFSFSNVFPIGDVISEGQTLSFIISSPDRKFISCLKKNFFELFWLGNLSFKVSKISKFSPSLNIHWKTASPVTLYKDNKRNLYVNLNKGDLLLFFKRLKENSLKKFKAFFGYSLEDISFFDAFKFKKQVSIQLSKKDSSFIILGSHWEFILPNYLTKEERKFFSFLHESGLGEKNSWGFGFVNSSG